MAVDEEDIPAIREQRAAVRDAEGIHGFLEQRSAVRDLNEVERRGLNELCLLMDDSPDGAFCVALSLVLKYGLIHEKKRSNEEWCEYARNWMRRWLEKFPPAEPDGKNLRAADSNPIR